MEAPGAGTAEWSRAERLCGHQKAGREERPRQRDSAGRGRRSHAGRDSLRGCLAASVPQPSQVKPTDREPAFRPAFLKNFFSCLFGPWTVVNTKMPKTANPLQWPCQRLGEMFPKPAPGRRKSPPGKHCRPGVGCRRGGGGPLPGLGPETRHWPCPRQRSCHRKDPLPGWGLGPVLESVQIRGSDLPRLVSGRGAVRR